IKDNRTLKCAYQKTCKAKPKTKKEELVLRIYNFILQIHVEKPWALSKEYRNLYSEFDLQVKFWGFVFETWFGENRNIILHWLKSVLATKCHLNDFLKAVRYLKESDITEVKFPIVQMMGLDAHLCVLRLDSKKSYVLEEVCAFPFPSATLHGIQSGGIENLINGLSNIESLLLDFERVYEESRYCQGDSMEKISRQAKSPKTFCCKDWATDVLLDEKEEEEESEEEEGSGEEEYEEEQENEEREA
ncbi:hypothetical protein INT45_006489, partial [Circinella minor]